MIDLILLILINITTALAFYWIIRIVYDSSNTAIRITLFILIITMVIAIVLLNYMILDLHYNY